MRILDCFFSVYIETEIKKISKDEIANLELQITNLFIFALIWAVGTTSNLDGRRKFDKWLRDKFAKNNIEFPEER